MRRCSRQTVHPPGNRSPRSLPARALAVPRRLRALVPLNTAACLASMRLMGARGWRTLTLGLYLPLIWSFGLGQDAPLILTAYAAGAHLVSRGRGRAGGVLLAACLLKPNIFFLAPLVLMAHRQGHALAAMSVTAAVMYTVAIPAAGFDWPARFVQAALANEAQIAPNILGLAGLIRTLGQPEGLRILVAIGGAGLVLVRTTKCYVEAALQGAVVGGLAFGPRAMIYDGVFLLP
ncbi:MAG: glycosyltransferase family 87 protein, partial [Bryobacteraceae bacterium]